MFSREIAKSDFPLALAYGIIINDDAFLHGGDGSVRSVCTAKCPHPSILVCCKPRAGGMDEARGSGGLCAVSHTDAAAWRLRGA